MLEYIGARALIERELRLTDFLVLLTTVANIGKILSFFECRQLRICNYVLCIMWGIDQQLQHFKSRDWCQSLCRISCDLMRFLASMLQLMLGRLALINVYNIKVQNCLRNTIMT